MKILIDMNLSPDWVAAYTAADIEAVHWSTIGDPRAEDNETVEYARSNGYIQASSKFARRTFCHQISATLLSQSCVTTRPLSIEEH